MRTSVTLRLILVFLSAPSIATPLPVKAEANTIFVPDDFPTIQEAIDNASEGDTVFVRKGTYDVWEYDAMNIDKSISLIGESSQDTIINRLPRGYSEAVIRVEADRVTISGFTLNGSNIGIYLWNTASNCKIVANKIAHNDIGVYVGASNSNIISGNNIIDSKNEGIFAHYSSDIVISENHIKNIHNTGIKVSYCQNITIKRNEIVGNANGLSFGTDTDHLYVYENNIIDNSGFGVQFDYANATVYNNNIMRNGIGINLQNFEFSSNSAMGGLGSRVYYNNIVDNTQNAFVQHTYPWNITVSSNGTDTISWDNGKVGNYWSDYQSKYPNAIEIDASGVGNTPYLIDENNVDKYPLMREVDISNVAPELDVEISLATITAITTVSVVAIVVSLAVCFKKLKH